jgi:pimeloyl-ACP methyl ester carboxylesterase
MGTFDKVTPRDVNVDGLLEKGLESNRLFELPTGHMVMLEAPDRLNEILEDLINEFQTT